MNYRSGNFDGAMGLNFNNLNKEWEKLTSSVTSGIASKAKATTISTLNDPEFKKTVNQFTKEWFWENKATVGVLAVGIVTISAFAFVNIISNYRLITKLNKE